MTTMAIMIEEALTAGILSAFGSTMGKLSGTPEAVGDNGFLWCFYVVLMIIAHTFNSRFYLYALDESSNFVTPTVIASASSYLLSGIIGIVLFKEIVPLQWWVGTSFILNGITLIKKQQNHK